MDWNAVLGQIIPPLIGLAIVVISFATAYIGGRSLVETHRAKKEASRLDAETAANNAKATAAQAEAEKAKAQAEQMSIFNLLVIGLQGRTDRQEATINELTGKNADLLRRHDELETKFDALGEELENVKQSRAAREKELEETRNRATNAEENLVTATKRIEELERKVTHLQEILDAAGIKDTREFQALQLPPDAPEELRPTA